MEIIESSQKEYQNVFNDTYHIFNSVIFNELNKDKCQEIKYLLFKDSKIRLGLILGRKDNNFLSPFSAPFGGFSFKDDQIQIQKIEDSLIELDKYCQKNKIKSIKIVLPPLFYNQTFISKLISCANRDNFQYEIDLNYSFNSEKFNDKYIEKILWVNSRRNLNIAQKQNFIFKRCDNLNEFKTAYDIIKQNRQLRGFPLRMSFDQVLKTIKIINCDSFLLYFDQKIIASAIVFHVAKEVVQVIYWGDLPKYYDKKTMNFLSYKIFEYYKNSGIKIIDIGPSTEKGIPNYGLCEFKESIGCDVSIKYTLNKKYD